MSSNQTAFGLLDQFQRLQKQVAAEPGITIFVNHTMMPDGSHCLGLQGQCEKTGEPAHKLNVLIGVYPDQKMEVVQFTIDQKRPGLKDAAKIIPEMENWLAAVIAELPEEMLL